MNNGERRRLPEITGVEDATGPLLPTASAGAMVAYIRDRSRGEVAVTIGGREITVTDHELVARLANAVRRASA